MHLVNVIYNEYLLFAVMNYLLLNLVEKHYVRVILVLENILQRGIFGSESFSFLLSKIIVTFPFVYNIKKDFNF